MTAGFKYLALLLFFQAVAFGLFAQPAASFTSSVNSGCSPLTVSYSSTTTGGTPGYTYVWQLGNSNTSTLANPSAIYYLPGTYKVTLIVTDSKGKVDSTSQSITVFKNPTADFSTGFQSGCVPFNVNFSNQSTPGSGKLTSWLWDFGDGNTSTSQNPGYHTYTAIGKYDVSLEVTDANGCTGYLIQNAYISVGTPPTVSFSANTTSSCSAPLKVNFTSSVKSTGDVTYSWNFGDGTYDSVANPVKTYSRNGSYSVSLTVRDSFGCTATKTIGDYIFIGKPSASFIASPEGGCAPLIVDFTSSSYGAPTGSDFYWNFGDGTVASGNLPIISHQFAAGHYTITMGVTTPGGCSDTIIMHRYINVSNPYQATFSVDSILCQAPYSAYFKNTSGDSTQVMFWHFGDSVLPLYPLGAAITHQFPDSGKYTIMLKVIDQNGCIESVTKNEMIKAGPTIASIKIDKVKGCAPLKVSFQNNSKSFVDSITSYFWSFGDGSSSTSRNPGSHIYQDTGIYKLALKVVTRHGCIAVDTIIIRSAAMPKADFTVYPDSGCLNMLRNVQFTNLSNTNYYVKGDSFAWYIYYDSAAPVSGHLDQPYTDADFNLRLGMKPGKYSVMLVAYNDSTCPDTMVKKNLITIAPPWAQYQPSDDTCALQNRVTFYDRSIGAVRVEYYFGDGDSSSLRNPTHIYQDTGTYFPYQVVYDSSNGCSDTFSYYSIYPLKGLYIKPPWVTSINPHSATTGCAPLKVFLGVNSNDTSTNVIDFGDGHDTTITTTNTKYTKYGGGPIPVVHIYQKPGVYTVKMYSTELYGCKQNIVMTPVIIVHGMSDGFKVTPSDGCVPLTVKLVDSSSSDIPLTINEFDMGDGNFIQVNSGTMYYTYSKASENSSRGFQINYIVSNGYCIDTESSYVYPHQPNALILAFNISNCDSVAYEFVHQATGYGPFKYLWIFGKNDTSTVVQPTRTFQAGSYDVKLKVTDIIGCIDTASVPILVQSIRDSADFTFKLSSGNCPPVSAFFTDASKFASPGGHKWLWDFGDGSSSTLENPSKVYYTAGLFTVTLKITDILGCTSTISKLNIIRINGATGEYSFDSKGGCAPVTVHFTGVSKNATKFEWDLGDGSVGFTDTLTHVYRRAGTYVPLLLLSDSSGCRYALPPKDTIVVNLPPVADFGYDSTCSGQPITLTDMSTTSTGKIIHWAWNFGDGSKISNQQNPTHIFKRNGFYPVVLTVTNNAGCSASVTKSVKYGDIIAQLKVFKTGCIGTPVKFKDLTLSDSAIKSWLWLFGDGSSSTLQNPSHVYLKKGIYPISLYVQNYKGCTDSLKNGAYILIGDTIPPNPPTIYRATVIDDQNAEIDYSRCMDFDFHKYLIHVFNENGKENSEDSVLFANDTIRIENNLNNLHHSYCFLVQNVNVCDYKSDTTLSQYHCTINLDALPGINESQLSWTPYSGWPVTQYKIYRLGAEYPQQFKLIDSVPGSQLKYIDTSVVCYRPMVYRIEGFEKNGNRMVSWSDTAATIPIHVAHVPPANMLRATVENNKNTLIEWLQVPNGHVKNWMLEKSPDGVNFTLIDTPITADIDSETDKNVDVQKTSYTYRLRILDSCGDLGPYSDIGKTILLEIDTTNDVKPYLVWSAYKNWPEGVQYYDVDIENADKSFSWLARTISGQDTEFIDKITDLNSLPNYTYHVVAHRNGTLLNPNQNIQVTSMSNDATLRPHSRLFVPNVFTPNGDGVNDSFFVQGLFITDFHIKIFDRWGTKVFESGSMKDKWSGSYKNGPPVMDAYKYLIYYRGVDNVERYTDGWVTILL